MDFPNITNDNLILYAMRHYDNPACHDVNEFTDDFDRIKYLKRLFKRYQSKKVLKDRLILNHIIIFYNVFGVDAGTRILFFRLEEDLWPILKTFLVFLNLLPEVVYGVDDKDILTERIAIDSTLVEHLKSI
jgi:hypothetical protein